MDVYSSMTFLLFYLALIFVNALSIMHILSSTRLVINCIAKLGEFCHCTCSGVFKVAFFTDENTVNNNDDLKANNNPNTSQSSSANSNNSNNNNNNNNSNNNSNNTKNNSTDTHGTSVWRDTTILLSDEKHRKHLSSNCVTSTSATATDGNCSNTSNDIIKIQIMLVIFQPKMRSLSMSPNRSNVCYFFFTFTQSIVFVFRVILLSFFFLSLST